MRRMAGSLLVPYALVVASLLLSAGCLSPAGEGPGDGGTGSASLEGSSWDLVSYLGSNGTTLVVLPGTRVTAAFSAGGRLAGSAGCNHYFGNYREDGGSLTVKGIGSNLVACLLPGVMDQEGRYLSLLGSAAGFRAEGDSLVISGPTDTPILNFQRERPPAPLPLTGTPWILESISTGSVAVSSVLAGTEIDILFSTDGKVTGSAGCNRYFAEFSLSGSSLSLGPVGSTKMYCSEPGGRMEQEQAYLSLLGSAAGYEITGGRLILKDARGSGILSFRRA